MITKFGEIVTEPQLTQIYEALDLDHDGVISTTEFSTWLRSADLKVENFTHERINLLKAKFNSKTLSNAVLGAGEGKEVPSSAGSPDSEEFLNASIQVELGDIVEVFSKMTLTHHTNPEKADAARNLLGREPNSAFVSIAFKCKPEINETQIDLAGRYLTTILKANITEFSEDENPLEDLKFHLSQEEGQRYLRCTAEIATQLSMMGAGLLGGIGIKDLSLDLEFGNNSSKISFLGSISRGSISMVEELVSNKELKQLGVFFLNNFIGADVKFKFSNLEELLDNFPTASVFTGNQQYIKDVITAGQKLVSDSTSTAHVAMVEQVLAKLPDVPEALEVFQAAWFAVSCAKENIKELSSITIVVGDEVFEITTTIPRLFDLIPSKDQMGGILNAIPVKPEFLLTDEEALKFPSEKQWKKHEAHELVLRNTLLDWVNHYWCDECETFGSGWCYACLECMTVIHPHHLKDE
uniref:EF-hand domain-containing protein n=1 Tax=Arcella intermedia TaxID=1963864 RepID=A0A6B2L2B3_9EUKA